MGELRAGNGPIGLRVKARRLSTNIQLAASELLRQRRDEHMVVRRMLACMTCHLSAKSVLKARDAEAFMNYIGGGDYSVPVGKIVYTQFLNNVQGSRRM